MAFAWWIWSNKKEEGGAISDDSSPTSSRNRVLGLGDPKTVTFPGLKKEAARGAASSPRMNIKKKRHSREERRVGRDDHDIVLVPSDGVCLSGSSESDEDSDWSVGWLEPHGADFLSDDETDDSFAVLVPCYRNDRQGTLVRGTNNNQQLLLGAFRTPTATDEHFTDGKDFMEQWLASLRSF